MAVKKIVCSLHIFFFLDSLNIFVILNLLSILLLLAADKIGMKRTVSNFTVHAVNE